MNAPRRKKVYDLGEFKLAGFAVENAEAGAERIAIQTCAALFSDNPWFHHCMRAFAQDVDAKLREQKAPVHLGQPTTEVTRNTVAHGKAPAEAFTAARALQIILALDQINRYLTVPS